MTECKYISDREAKVLAAVLAVLIIIPALWMAREVLTAPQTMIPVLIGVPLIAAIIWYEWGRTSQNWGAYALFLAAALALPVGAALAVLLGPLYLALGYSPLMIGAVCWAGAVIAIIWNIQRQKKGVTGAA